MAIHVNIGEAKTRLSELIAAAERGEDVVIARASSPRVRLVPITDPSAVALEQTAEKRRTAIGSLRSDFEGFDVSLRALKGDRTDSDERYRLKFEPDA